jgi:hypothetical protein
MDNLTILKNSSKSASKTQPKTQPKTKTKKSKTDVIKTTNSASQMKTNNTSPDSGFIYGSTVILAIIGSVAIYIMYMIIGASNIAIYQWVIYPVIMYILSVCVFLIGNTIYCKGPVNVGRAFISSLSTYISIIGFMILSSFSFLRIPIASVIGRLEIPTNAMKQADKQLYSSQGILALEYLFPRLKGLSVGFYMFFAIMFGQVITSSLSQTC